MYPHIRPIKIHFILLSAALIIGRLSPCHASIDSIKSLLEDVTGAQAFRFDAKDNLGIGLDTIKIIENPTGGYIGIYHHLISGEFRVRLATSVNLLDWTYRRTLVNNASQPTIAYHTASGGFYIVYEQWMSPGSTGASHLKVDYYNNVESLLNSDPEDFYIMPHSPFNPSNLEGTPNIYSISPDGNTIEIGFHYYNSSIAKDRNARGWLTGFHGRSRRWTSQIETDYNTKLIAMGSNGNLGDRDNGNILGNPINLQEGQLNQYDFGSWRTYLYDLESASFHLLNIKTPKGSTAFGNPTFTLLTLPECKHGIVVTYFIFGEGAAPGEAGQLIFYRELPSSQISHWLNYR